MDLADVIASRLSDGYRIDAIRREVQAHGWPPDEVDRVLRAGIRAPRASGLRLLGAPPLAGAAWTIATLLHLRNLLATPATAVLETMESTSSAYALTSLALEVIAVVALVRFTTRWGAAWRAARFDPEQPGPRKTALLTASIVVVSAVPVISGVVLLVTGIGAMAVGAACSEAVGCR